MKLEVGKFYKDSDGDKVKIVYSNVNNSWFIGEYQFGTLILFNISGYTESYNALRIIEEWKEPLDIFTYMNANDVENLKNGNQEGGYSLDKKPGDRKLRLTEVEE